MRNPAISCVAAGILSLAATGAAHAVTVSIFHTQPSAAIAAADATIAQAGTLGAPDATLELGNQINFTNMPFNNSEITTISQFLGNPAGLDPTLGNMILNNTYFLFTGTIALDAGVNTFSVTHDDGLQLSIAGATPSPFILDAPGPTAPTVTPFLADAPAAGVYAFTLAYGETGGGIADLLWDFNPGVVPEPAAWTMLILGFAGVGGLVRRGRASVALVTA